MSADTPPFAVAVTGGVASGKTAVTDRFAALAIPVVDADQVSRDLVEPGRPALTDIVDQFGTGVIDHTGRLDRAALRRIVFTDPARRRQLEAILHPLVRDEMQLRARQSDSAYVVLAIPLLVESGHYPWVQRVLLIDVPELVQQQRVIQRDGIDAAAAAQMLAAQASRQQRLAVANDVIVNDAGLDLLDACVGRLDRRYRQLAAALPNRSPDIVGATRQ